MTDFAGTPDLGAGATDDAAPPPPTLMQKLGAEALGTAVLVFVGCGAAVMTGADIVATGLAFGIAVVMMAYAVGRVSGGHFNPAISLGAALSGRLTWKDFGLYTAAQVGGGLIGGLLLALTVLASDIGWEFGDPLGSNGYGSEGGVELLGALLIELLLTFIFLMVILGVTDERDENASFAPLAIGLSLAAIHFVAIPATGTSVNPARSIGVAFFSGGDAIAQLWLFIVAPFLGGAIAGLVYPLIFGRGSEPVPGSGLNFGSQAPPQTGFAAGYQQQWAEQQAPFGHQPQAGPYGAPDAGQAPTGFGAHQGADAQQGQPAQQQPIIQNGWQWDPDSQQWIPAQQPPAPGGGDSTMVRPPEGP
jgi:aquaporin Z